MLEVTESRPTLNQPRSRTCPKLKRLGWLVGDHFGGEDALTKILTNRSTDPSDVRKLIKANQAMLVAESCMNMGMKVLMHNAVHFGMTPYKLRQEIGKLTPEDLTQESLSTGTNQVAYVTSFVTQAVHRSLEIFPRLLANEIVSIQPLTAPAGYVFAVKQYDETNRQLSDLETFDKNYTRDPGEGEQIKKVTSKITKQLVEAQYRKLMWEDSWESEVAWSSQHGGSLEGLNDALLSDELAWESDRDIIDDLLSFASATYTFDPTKGGTYNSAVATEQQAWDKNFLRITYNQAETDMQAAIYAKPNFAIAGTQVISFLKRLREYEAYRSGNMEVGDMVTTNGSIAFDGRLEGMNVWHDPQMDHCTMLLGHINKMDPYRAGYIWCPFGMASLLTGMFRDPNTLLGRKARCLAYAKKGIKSEQFVKIKIGSCS